MSRSNIDELLFMNLFSFMIFTFYSLSVIFYLIQDHKDFLPNILLEILCLGPWSSFS